MEQQLPSIVGSKQQPIGQLATDVKAPLWRNQSHQLPININHEVLS